MKEQISDSSVAETITETPKTAPKTATEWLTFGKLLTISLTVLGCIVALLSLTTAPETPGSLTLALRDRIMSLFGLFALMAIAYGLSNNRAAINLRLVVVGLLLQLGFVLVVLKTTVGRGFFQITADGVTAILSFTNKGSEFLFGSKLMDTSFAFIFAFQVLPTIIFVSSLTAVLYYFGILQFVVGFMARTMSKLLKISGAESLACAVNVFVGQTEAPLFIRPYVSRMTNSELMLLMTGGFATIAGAVMAAYAIFLTQAGLHSGPGHLLAASVISAPAAIVIAKIMFPETQIPQTGIGERVSVPVTDVNALDAAARGASEGLKLAVNVAAMLLVFIAFIAMFNWGVGSGLDKALTWMGLPSVNLSLEKIFGWLFAPLAWIMGTPWQDCTKVGNLLGQKTVINEFVAYLSLADMIKAGELSIRSQVISIYALCGFSNFASIAIQLGGIGSLAPDRRGDLAKLGLKAMIAGSLACFMTATVAGLLV